MPNTSDIWGIEVTDPLQPVQVSTIFQIKLKITKDSQQSFISSKSQEAGALHNYGIMPTKPCTDDHLLPDVLDGLHDFWWICFHNLTAHYNFIQNGVYLWQLTRKSDSHSAITNRTKLFMMDDRNWL